MKVRKIRRDVLQRRNCEFFTFADTGDERREKKLIFEKFEKSNAPRTQRGSRWQRGEYIAFSKQAAGNEEHGCWRDPEIYDATTQCPLWSLACVRLCARAWVCVAFSCSMKSIRDIGPRAREPYPESRCFRNQQLPGRESAGRFMTLNNSCWPLSNRRGAIRCKYLV